MLQPIRPQDAGQVYQRQITPGEVAGAAPRRADAVDGHTTPGRRTDRAQFSSAALDLSRALRTVADAPDVREGRVEALRAAIQDGTYRVDADVIAERLAEQGFTS